jgi:hypothetical protein
MLNLVVHKVSLGFKRLILVTQINKIRHTNDGINPPKLNIPEYSNVLLTYSMEQSPFWKANQFAATQEIHRIFMEPEGSLPYS